MLYPSIPHLPGSRAASDRVLQPAQARRFIDAAYVSTDVVIVEEKLDGSCVLAAREGDAIVAYGRDGGLAAASLNEGRRMFAAWVEANAARFREVLGDGERIAGEWLALAHGIRYELPHQPFVVFDVFCKDQRASREDVRERAKRGKLTMAGLVHEGGPIAIEDAVKRLGRGFSGAREMPEGVVYRIERTGRVIDVAKWVRGDKVDGELLPEKTGREAVWNWRR
ncbi:MAG TPA: RNA ligase family protein [Polyangiaceae bacterium]|nr:RNA ligase family protein [Polyangiaceae bacterium]